MKSAVVVSSFYRPEHSGIAPYSTALAELLASRTWDVTVYAGMPHYPSWKVDPAYKGWFKKERLEGVEVRRVRQFLPRRQTALQRALYEASFLGHLLRWFPRSPPSAVIGVTPCLSAGLLAVLVARFYGVPCGLVVQDLVGLAAAQSGMQHGWAVHGTVSRVEGWVVRQATRVAVVSQGFRQYLLEQGVASDRLYYLPNWTLVQPPQRRRDETRRLLGWSDDEWVVLHAGNMGLKQNLEVVVQAATEATERRLPLRFVLLGSGSQHGRLLELGRNIANLSFMDPVGEDAFSDVLAAADLLLVNERPSVVDMSLPSKLTSYFVAGRPIVAAVTSEGATARELRRVGAGVVCQPGNPLALLECVNRLRMAPAQTGEWARNGEEYARSHLSRAAAEVRLEAFVHSLSLER